MRTAIQKLKAHKVGALFVTMGIIVPFAFTQLAFASLPGNSGGCPDISPNVTPNCSSIPLGCPGSTKTGTVSAKATIQCKYVPISTSTWTCGAKECDFSNPTVTIPNGKPYPGDSSSGSGNNGGLSNVPDQAAQGGNCATPSQCDLITKFINPFINLMAGLVGVAVVISITIGGVQYSSAGGDPQKVSAAKNRIRNAIIALVAYFLLYALLNFLVPGGLV